MRNSDRFWAQVYVRLAATVILVIYLQHSQDAELEEINLENGSSELVGHTGAVYGVDLPPSHSLLLSSSADSTLRLWHTELGSCINLYR